MKYDVYTVQRRDVSMLYTVEAGSPREAARLVRDGSLDAGLIEELDNVGVGRVRVLEVIESPRDEVLEEELAAQLGPLVASAFTTGQLG